MLGRTDSLLRHIRSKHSVLESIEHENEKRKDDKTLIKPEPEKKKRKLCAGVVEREPEKKKL